MRIFRFFQINTVKDKLFEYPCVDSNSAFLSGKKVCLFNATDFVNVEKFIDLGAEVVINPSYEQLIKVRCAVLSFPRLNNQDDGRDLYYEILDYYIHNLKHLIYKMQNSEGFSHLLVVLPKYSNQYCSTLRGMAYYAIYGLIKGLGKVYAPQGVFVNGILYDEMTEKSLLNEWITYILSDNANNIVGQIIEV